jgi:Protein of unknown function (DUF3170).
VSFVGEHFAHRDAGPAGDHGGNGFGVDLFRHQWVVLANRVESGFQPHQFSGQVIDAAVGAFVRFVAVGAFAQGEQLAAGFQQFAHGDPFFIPAHFQFANGLHIGDGFGFQQGDAFTVIEPGGLFATQAFDFILEAVLAMTQAFQRRRHVVLAEGNPGARGVEHADGLVWQLASGNVAMGQFHRFMNRGVQHLHTVMLLQFGGNATEHFHGGDFIRFLDLHQLKTPGEGRVFLEVFFVLQPRGGGQGAQLAAGQSRFQQVGRVAATFCATGADQGVGFVDKQNDRFFRAAHGVDHAFESLFELALDPGTGLQQPEVEYPQADFLQRRRHVCGGDAQGQAFDHGGFTDTRSTHQDRVVLPTPQQDVDALTDLAITPDDRVDTPGVGIGSQVLSVLIEY